MNYKSRKAKTAADEARQALLLLAGDIVAGNVTQEVIGQKVDEVVSKIVEAATTESSEAIARTINMHIVGYHPDKK